MTEQTLSTASDIATESWIDKWAPASLRPYCRLARLDRPIGTWLLLLPCWWSLALASDGWPNPLYVVLFAVGALVMRGAGCTINDLADRDFDAQVARTVNRPIANGDLTARQAYVFLGVQLGLGFIVLLQFNSFTIWLGVSSLGLIVVYPFMKRITYWPQAFLGLAFNWGALVGWAAETGQLQAAPIILYAAGFFWTMGYDTIYAHQDKADDAMIGVKSTALKFGAASKNWISSFYATSLVLVMFSGHMAQMGWPFYAAVGLGALHMGWQVWSLDTDDPKSCLRRFKSNRDFGLILLSGIIISQLVT